MAQMKYVAPDTDIQAALQEIDRDGVNQLHVMTNKNIQGILTREDVISYMHTL